MELWDVRGMQEGIIDLKIKKEIGYKTYCAYGVDIPLFTLNRRGKNG